MNKHNLQSDIILPDDVLIIIFSELPRHACLINFACACKYFKALALPLLYRSIRLEATWLKDSDYSSLRPEEPPPGLVPESLSLSLQKYPDLRDCVQSLSLKVHNVSWYENRGGHQRLLKFLPSIQELSLNPPPKEYDFPRRDQLVTVKLDFEYAHGRYWAPGRRLGATEFDLDKYLSLPKVGKLQLEHSEDVYYRPVNSGRRRSSAVTDLCFIDWHPGYAYILVSVLPSIRVLKHLVFEVGGYWQFSGIGGSTQGFAPHDYGLSLQPHAESLEDLVIAYSDKAYSDGVQFPGRPSPVMGTLTNFHELKRLAIPEPFLVSHKDASFHIMLPRQLEELQIQYPMGVQVRDRQVSSAQNPPYRLMRMQKLAKNKQTFVPRLKYVVWWFQQTFEQLVMVDNPWSNPTVMIQENATQMSDDQSKGPLYGPPKDMDELREEFCRVGVRFEWVSTPCFKDTPFAESL